MITTISILNIGFSLVVSALLLISYLFFLNNINKSWLAISACIALLVGLSAIQLELLAFLRAGADPLETLYFRFLLFLVPPMFYFFSRSVLFPDKMPQYWDWIHLTPLPLVFFILKDIAIPIAFLIGASYCFWLVHLIYSLRAHRKRFKVEFFFFGFFSVLAVLVLIFGFCVSYLDNAYFYYFYANGIGLAFILVTAALIIFPDLLEEITEAVALRYSTSTLNNVDLEASLKKLDALMTASKMYQNENLSLSMMAQAMALTSHQLSELINTQYGLSFSKFIRQQRVEEAKKQLISEPDSSVLSISLATGFKSQSNFYVAFKELTGQTPGGYRKAHSK